MFSLIFGGLTSLASSIVAAYNKSKDVTIAAFQATGSIAAAQATAMTAWIGHPLSPPSLLCYAVALYYGKAIAYDNVISIWITGHEGFTSGLKGDTSWVAMTIISGMFFSGIAKIIRQ